METSEKIVIKCAMFTEFALFTVLTSHLFIYDAFLKKQLSSLSAEHVNERKCAVIVF